MMKFALITLVGIATAVLDASAQERKAQTPPPVPETPKKEEAADGKEFADNVSYAVGLHFGNQLKRSEFDFNMDEISKAMKDVLTGGATRMTEAQSQQTIQKWQMEQRSKQEAKRKKEGEENKKKGQEFLAENAKKPNVKMLQPGLQYEVLTEGKGKIPNSNDTVKVHYTGTLINGTEFDSSRAKGSPAEFRVTGVIKGWTEALQKMPTGSRWKLFIAPELAYGEFGRPNIPPNSVLIFDVELLEIKQPEPPKTEESVQAVSGEIIKVPSAEELKKGAKIEVLKEEDVKRMLATNAPGNKATTPGKPQNK